MSKESDDFIFKGGNLLWLYIHTPRQTIDLDLVTRTLDKTAEVKRVLEKSCRHGDGIEFELSSIQEVSTKDAKGAAATIRFLTQDGASNTFDLDIVYTIPTQSAVIPSPLHAESQLQVATIENVIADKVSACHRFGGGNTRMKDFDDLWRLARSEQTVNWRIAAKLLGRQGLSLTLNVDWINAETSAAWARHVRRYNDLPGTLSDLFSAVNKWLGKQ